MTWNTTWATSLHVSKLDPARPNQAALRDCRTPPPGEKGGRGRAQVKCATPTGTGNAYKRSKGRGMRARRSEMPATFSLANSRISSLASWGTLSLSKSCTATSSHYEVTKPTHTYAPPPHFTRRSRTPSPTPPRLKSINRHWATDC